MSAHDGFDDAWPERFTAAADAAVLAGPRAFVRLFDPRGVPDAALVVAGGTVAYLVRPNAPPLLVHEAEEPELLYGALADLVTARTAGEWREVPDDVPRALRDTAAWVVQTACLRSSDGTG